MKPGPSKHILFFVILAIGLGAPVTSTAQFLNIQIDVEPEVETTVEQSLDFGQVITGAGLQFIPPGSPNMGIFKIRGLRTQRLIIQIDADEELLHSNPDILDRIPVNLQATYTNFGIEDFELSEPLNDISRSIVLESPLGNPSAAWSSIFVYIYGSVDIGNVRDGVYTGNVVLTVIYE